jgi:hypothetical protein
MTEPVVPEAEACGVAPGDVVQLRPDTAYPYCYMVVLEARRESALGYVCVPQSQGKLPGRAFLRVRHNEMVVIGKQVWVPPFFEEERTRNG